MSKYNSKKLSMDGEVFDSKKELRRYMDLLDALNAGEISCLERQVKFELIPKQRDADGKAVRPCSYVADFVYRDNETGETVVEDVKGFKTKEYRIKWKLMLWVNGITVREV
jgi:hypothetical protein